MKFGGDNGPQGSPQPMPISEVKSIIKNEAPNLFSSLCEISPDGMTASLGQVHQGKLNSGEIVAIKVKYPFVDSEIFDQLDIMIDTFTSLPMSKKSGIDTEGYREFFRAYFTEELDYMKEASSQKLFLKAWSGNTSIVIPDVHSTCSSRSILVQSFESSNSLEEIKLMSTDSRKRCATLLTTFFWEGILVHGLVHTDLHPKNWGYREEEDKLVVYDFGAVLNLSEEIRNSLKSLIAEDLSSSEYLKTFGVLGFNPTLISMILDKISDLVLVMTKPLHHNEEWNLKEWNVKDEMAQILGAHSWVFRSAGDPWFLLFMRGFYGWLHAIQELNISLDYTKIIPIHSKKPARIIHFSPPNLNLRVSVKEGINEIVNLELPVGSVASIEDMIPDHVLKQLSLSGIDLELIKVRTLENNYCEQEIFKCDSGNRRYRVWIG